MSIENKKEFCSFFILASEKTNDNEQDLNAIEKRKKYVLKELNKAFSESEKLFFERLSEYGQLKSKEISFDDYFEVDCEGTRTENSLFGKYGLWKWQYECTIPWDSRFIKINKKIYKIHKELINSNYDSEGRIWINFEIEKLHSISENNGFDEDFERLKIAIKDFWLECFGTLNDKVIDVECFWQIDEQSKELSLKSYLLINTLENKLRTFINMVMAREIGACWFQNFGGKPTKTSESRKGGYETDVEIFANVNNYLASMNSDDLCKILQYEELTSKEMQEGYLDDEINEISKGGSDRAVEILNKLYSKITKSKNSYWSLYFAEYFDFPLWINGEKKVIKTDFVKKWEEFCKKRNHVAHNKYLSYQFYTDLIIASEEINRYLDDAYSINKDNQECQDREAYELEMLYSPIYDVLPSAPHEYLLRGQREADLLHILLTRFWNMRDKLMNKHGKSIVFNSMFEKGCCDVWENRNDNKFFQGLSELVLSLYREELCIMESSKCKLTMIRGKYRENDNELGYVLKLYGAGEGERIVNCYCYYNAFCFHCNGVYEEDIFLGGEFADFCSRVELAFERLELI